MNILFIVDVGATYVPETHRYDHHQREFTGTLDGYKTKLSSAGLVYKHFGRQVLSSIVKENVAVTDPMHNRLCDILYHKVSTNLLYTVFLPPINYIMHEYRYTKDLLNILTVSIMVLKLPMDH